MRALFLLPALVVASIGSSVPAHSGSLPPLLVTARLYAWHGHWTPVDWKQMVNSDPLRVTVQVSTPYSPATRNSVGVSLRHVTWPASHAVIELADVEAPLRQTMQHSHLARFQAILHVPVTHPLQFSRVVITVTHGTTVETVTSGVTFTPPTIPAQALLLLTVPQVFSFCAARPSVPYLMYGLAVRSYVHEIISTSQGPPGFIVSARRTVTNNATTLANQGKGFGAAGGMFNQPFYSLLTGNRHVTISGSLACHPQVSFNIMGVSR